MSLLKTKHIGWQVLFLIGLLLLSPSAYSQSPSAFCDNFEDGDSWQSRWGVSQGYQTLVSSPAHSGTGALEFHGGCESSIYRKNFSASAGYYTAWVNQRHYEAGFAMFILFQPGGSSEPWAKEGYALYLSAQDTQIPSFVFERQYDGGVGYVLGTGVPSFLKDEWIQVFIRRLPGNTFVAGYERNGVRDSIVCSDPNAPIDPAGEYCLWACSDVPPYTYFDDVCYQALPPVPQAFCDHFDDGLADWTPFHSTP
ncbi:MAG: hypothetical protein NT028_11650, partial [candidate division Zixibacteria bacterium]|nr:hypothetical protein [candidate division Zixibacteria bacterium]